MKVGHLKSNKFIFNLACALLTTGIITNNTYAITSGAFTLSNSTKKTLILYVKATEIGTQGNKAFILSSNDLQTSGRNFYKITIPPGQTRINFSINGEDPELNRIQIKVYDHVREKIFGCFGNANQRLQFTIYGTKHLLQCRKG